MFSAFQPSGDSGWTNKGTLGANLPPEAKVSKVLNKGNGNFCLIAMDGGTTPTHSLPVSKKASAGDSAKELTLWCSPSNDLVLGTSSTLDIEWE